MILISQTRADNFHRYKWLCDPILGAWIVHMLRPYGKSILDVGCGNGYMFERYAGEFEKIGAIDPSASLEQEIRKNAEKNNVVFKTGCAEHIPFARDEFDVVLAKSSLHHFTDVRQGLREMARVAAHAFAVVEVVAPTDGCLPFLQTLLTRKEEGRAAESVYTAQTLKKTVGETPHISGVYQHFFDQYIEIDTWLEYSDVGEKQKKDIMQTVWNMGERTRLDMQFHNRAGHPCMLRRMCLTLALKEQGE